MKASVLIFALALASCGTKAVDDLSGAGFVMETPNAASRSFIIKNDRPFAEQVAVNRATCLKLAGCRK